MKECRILKSKQVEKKGKAKEKSDEETTTVVATHDDMFVFCDNGQVNIIHYDSDWVVDSGASYHVTPYRHFFSIYTEGDFRYVWMENEVSCKVVGMGDIYLDTDTGCQLILRNVRHVLDIRFNLISIRKLKDEGYYKLQGGGKWKLNKGNLVVTREKKHSTLYVMQTKLRKREVNAVRDSSIDFWHRRLGLMGEKGIQTLVYKQLLPEIRGNALKTCVDCIYGK